MPDIRDEDGYISFEVPNKDALPFVKAYGHFMMFDILNFLKMKSIGKWNMMHVY
jgi:hypothetical protein